MDGEPVATATANAGGFVLLLNAPYELFGAAIAMFDAPAVMRAAVIATAVVGTKAPTATDTHVGVAVLPAEPDANCRPEHWLVHKLYCASLLTRRGLQ